MTRSLSLALLLFVAAAGCVDDPAMPDPQPTGDHYAYFVDEIDMPQTPNEAYQLGLNLDGDSAGRPDNAFGQVLAAVVAAFPEYDLDAEAEAQLGDRMIEPLFDLQTPDLNTAAYVGLEVMPFATDPGRGTGLLTGSIVNARLDVGYGSVPVAFTFPGLDEAFVVTLDDARVVAEIDGGTMTGVIGGGMTDETVQTELIPALQRGFDNIVARDCPDGADSCTSDFAAALLDTFDTAPYDGRLSVDEIRNSTLISALLAPDLDIDQDGVKDELSVGLGFTAVAPPIQLGRQ